MNDVASFLGGVVFGFVGWHLFMDCLDWLRR
jgi:hypothetical protein